MKVLRRILRGESTSNLSFCERPPAVIERLSFWGRCYERILKFRGNSERGSGLLERNLKFSSFGSVFHSM
jgi:hypothetical protein